MMRSISLLIVLALLAVAPVAAEKKLEEMESFYKDAKTGDSVKYKMTLESTGQEASSFALTYTVKEKLFTTISIETVRRFSKSLDKVARTLLTKFSLAEDLNEQFKANYKKYGFTQVQALDGSLFNPKIVGKVRINAGGKVYECLKIVCKFKAKRAGTAYKVEETFYYNKTIKVMKMAKMEGSYSFDTTGGMVQQKVTLILSK